MSNHGMSREAMLAGLRDIRLPQEAAGGWIADIAAVVGISAVSAVLVLGLLRLYGARRVEPHPAPIPRSIEEISGLPPEKRRLAMLRYLKERDQERYAQLTKGDALYRPDGIAAETIEAEARRSA